MNADRVVQFYNQSTREEINFLLTILCQDILVYDGKSLTNVETSNLNGTCFQLNLDSIED